MAGFNQGFVCASIEPRKTSAEDLDEQVTSLHVGPVDIGDLQLAARRRFERCGDIEDVVVVEIEAGDRDFGFRLGRLFLDRKSPSVAVEFDDAVLLR